MANRISPDPTAAGHYEWEVPGTPPVSLRYNELLQSLRVHSGNERRVYLLESSHFPASKVSLFTEYGLEAGSCTFEDTRQPSGLLRVEGVKYRFRTEGGRVFLSSPGADHTFPWELPPGTHHEVCAGFLLTLARQVRSLSPEWGA